MDDLITNAHGASPANRLLDDMEAEQVVFQAPAELMHVVEVVSSAVPTREAVAAKVGAKPLPPKARQFALKRVFIGAEADRVRVEQVRRMRQVLARSHFELSLHCSP